ncbi:hypothetical protein OIO90_000037 [Microbotryomycetes sp. JL221]|nr:hypothetical protein OIO90_000037 [Microbotryomycetes sp. JL221]
MSTPTSASKLLLSSRGASSPNSSAKRSRPWRSRSQPRHRSARLDQAFNNLGRWLALHQIKALLLCAVVMCALLSPAMLLFFEPTTADTSPLSLLSSPQTYRGQFAWEMDVMQRQGIVASTEDVCWDRLNSYHESRGQSAPLIRVEQLLVSTTAPHNQQGWSGATLSKPTLHRALKLQHELERRLERRLVNLLDCVRDLTGHCAVISPVEWWASEEELLQDQDVHKTLSEPARHYLKQTSASSLPSSNGTARVPLTSASTLVGIGRNRFGAIRDASRLVITFLLRDTANVNHVATGQIDNDEAARMAWRETVRQAMDGIGWSTKEERVGKSLEWQGHAERVILKHLPNLVVVSNPRRSEAWSFFFGYILVAFYVRRRVRPLKVNSKIGLLVTGVVQLATSGIMSISICWLLGWKIGLVPWNLIAFLVLVCGVDNMLVMTTAIGSVDMQLPIEERVAQGLANTGPITLATLAAQLCMALIIHVTVKVPVFRQTVKYAAVVLVVDLFLEMSFFATILSIDTQRLELADLLSSSSFSTRPDQLTPSETDEGEQIASLKPTSWISSLWSTFKGAVSDRPACMCTFALLFTIDSLLYAMYGPDHFLPAFCSETALSSNRPALAPSLSSEIQRNLLLGQRGKGKANNELPLDAGRAFWRIINPTNISSVHLLVQPPVGVQLFDDGLNAPESVAHEVVKATMWARLATVLLPIAATLFTLWLVLLYLLKDADLLETARNKLVQKQVERRTSRVGAKLNVTRLRGKRSADVELVASSHDSLLSWAGLDDVILIWKRLTDRGKSKVVVGTLEIPLSPDPPSLTMLAIDDTSRFCAAATTAGRVLVWSIERKLLVDFRSRQASMPVPDYGQLLGLVALANHVDAESDGSASPSSMTQKPAPPNRRNSGNFRPAESSKDQVSFLSVHRTGAVIVWDCMARMYSVCFHVPMLAESTTMDPFAANRIRTWLISPTTLVPRLSTPGPLVACSNSTTGRVALYRSDGASSGRFEEWTTLCDEALTDPRDPLTCLAYADYVVDDLDYRGTIVILGTMSGKVTLVRINHRASRADTELNEEITPSNSGHSSRLVQMEVLRLDLPVRQIRIKSTRSDASRVGIVEKCSTCSRAMADGLVVIASSKTTISGVRVSLKSSFDGEECRCTVGRRAHLAEPQDLGSGVMRGVRKPRRTSQGRLANLGSAMSSGEDTASLKSDEQLSTGSADSRSPFRNGGDFVANGSSREDVPMFDMSDPFNSSPFYPVAGQPDVRIRDVFTTTNDERAGWDLADEHIVGLRRGTSENMAATRSSNLRSWVVWSLPINKVGAEPSEWQLETLLSMATTVDGEELAQSMPDSSPHSTHSVLRRRHTSNNMQLPSRAGTTPLIRFENIDLPFSRIRPIGTAFDKSSIVVGLGNQLAVLTPLSPLAQLMQGAASRHGLAVPGHSHSL